MVEQRVEKYEIHSYYKNQNESETKKKDFQFLSLKKFTKLGVSLKDKWIWTHFEQNNLNTQTFIISGNFASGQKIPMTNFCHKSLGQKVEWKFLRVV